MTKASWPHDDVVHGWWVERGRVLAGEYPMAPDGSTTKLERLIDSGIVTFVDLTAPADGLVPYGAVAVELGRARGTDVRHAPCPIPDMGVVDLDGYRAILDLIDEELALDRPVYVHCWGGVGRTGTVVGCLLARRGVPGDAIEARLAELRVGTSKAARPSPETRAQRDAIAAWAASLQT